MGFLFQFMPIIHNTKSKYKYTAWLSDKDGNNVMEYILTKEKLQEFCSVIHDKKWKDLK
jgi:hypothetical protein